MENTTSKLWTGIALSVVATNLQAAMPERPNVIYIMTDQQSWNMMGCTGNKWLSTPNMDRIAREGYRFERTYCVNPVSSPSRFSLVTGHYASEVGVRENTPAYDRAKVRQIAEQDGLGYLFRRAGYETLYSGKTHLYGGNATLYGFTFDGENPYEGPALYAEKVLAEKAGKPQDRPFFLFLSFMNPHDICYKAGMDERWPDRIPEEKRQETIRLLEVFKKMDKTEYKRQIPPRVENFAPNDGEIEEMVSMSNRWRDWQPWQWDFYSWFYHRLTESVDAQIGRVLDALDKSGLKENTIIVFTSDHGDMNGAHGLLLKNVMFEEAQRVPFIFAGPGIRKGVTDRETLVCNGLDFIPTICDLTGVTCSDALPGRSLKKQLIGEGGAPDREYIVLESYNSYQITDGRYKYTLYELPGHPAILVDLNVDPGEKHNCVADPAYASIQKRMHEALLAQLDVRGLLPLSEARDIKSVRKAERAYMAALKSQQKQSENKKNDKK